MHWYRNSVWEFCLGILSWEFHHIICVPLAFPFSSGDVKEAPFLFLLPVGILLLLIVLIPMPLWRLLMMKKVAKPESLVRGIPSTGNTLGKISLPLISCYGCSMQIHNGGTLRGNESNSPNGSYCRTTHINIVDVVVPLFFILVGKLFLLLLEGLTNEMGYYAQGEK